MTDFTNVPEESLFQASLRGSIDSTQTTGIVISEQIQSFQGDTILTFLNPVGGAEFVKCTGQNISGELTGVTRGLPKYDGGPSTATTHPSGTRVVLSNPFQVYKDIATAVNSKADILAPTIDEPTFTDWVKLPGYADAAARDVAIPVPADNMTVILEDDGNGYTCLSVYRNAQWNNITLPSQDVTVNGFLVVADGYVKFPVYVDDAARNAAIPTPSQSMIIYNANAVTFQFYDGVDWNNLDVGTPVPLATQLGPGRVRLATDQQVLDRIDDVSGEPLVVQPSQVNVGYIIEAILNRDMVAGEPVGVSAYLTDTDIYVDKANDINMPVTFATIPNKIVRMIPLDDTRFVILYQTTSTTSAYAVVATIDFDAHTIVLGAAEVVTAAALISGTLVMTLIGTDKLAVSYAYSATSTVARCKILDIAGAAITVGAERTIFTVGAGAIQSINIDTLDTNKVISTISSSTAASSRLVAFTVAGDNITPGTDLVQTANLQGGSPKIVSIDTDKFAVVSTNSSSTGYIVIGTVAGTTITLGSEDTYTRQASMSGDGLVYKSSTDKLMVTTGAARFALITVMGTTITEADSVNLGTGGQELVLAKKADDLFIYQAPDSTTSSTNEGYILAISGSTLTATLKSRNGTFLNNGVAGFSIDGRVVSNVNEAALTINFREEGLARNFIGYLIQGGSRGDRVQVRLKDIPLDFYSGLLPGNFYRLNSTVPGAITLLAGVSTSFADSVREQNLLFLAVSSDLLVQA